jgi:uncharacterized protein (DUF4415 family)
MVKRSSASFQPDAQPGTKGSATSRNAPGKPEVLDPTAAAGKPAALADLPDDAAVDTSDIPELTDDFWNNAERGVFYRPVKQPLTIRIDADVIAWFKKQAGQGGHYQTQMNRVLREYMRRRDSGAD